MHLGYGTSSVFGDADLLVFAECDVPWIPSMEEPPADTTIVQCGVDPVFSRYPIRTHRSDLLVTGSMRQLFVDLSAALETRKGKIDPGRLDRIARLASDRRDRRRSALELQVETKSGITKAFMNSVLAKIRPPEAIVVDEYWARADCLQSTVEGTEFHNPPAGGLGWGLPAALGVQLESPGRTVISTLGDGAYMFANPPACHQVMSTYQLPVLTIVCNNGRWGAVEGSARLCVCLGMLA
jgi:acetolactate synthase-1/2/3 large subunit